MVKEGMDASLGAGQGQASKMLVGNVKVASAAFFLFFWIFGCAFSEEGK